MTEKKENFSEELTLRSNCRPLVSVVIPAFNHETWIVATLKSVFNQSLTDFEVIVVDDGSRDHTVQAISSFSDSRMQLVLQENRGTSAAINRGLSLSRGKYIAILNSDDIFLPERLAVLVELLENNPECMMAFSRVSLIDEKGIELSDECSECRWLRSAQTDYYEGGDLLLSLLRDNFLCTSSNFFFRRRLLLEVGLFRDLRYVNDLDFLFRALSRYKACYCEQVLLAYRQHAGNTLKERELKKRADFLLELSLVLATALEEGGLVRQWDFSTVVTLLVQYYRLNLETLLFSILYFRRQRKGFNGLNDLAAKEFEVLLSQSRRRLEEQDFVEDLVRQAKEQHAYIGTLQEAQSFYVEQMGAFEKLSKRLDEHNKELQEHNKELQEHNKELQEHNKELQERNKELQERNSEILLQLRGRDQEIARMEQFQHEIWRNREWYRQQYEMVLNSKRFRLFTILAELGHGRRVLGSLRELSGILLPPLLKEKLRWLRTKIVILKTGPNFWLNLKKKLEFFVRRFFDSHRYRQEIYSCAPLLTLLIFCDDGVAAVATMSALLKMQTWSNFEVVFLVCSREQELRQRYEAEIKEAVHCDWKVETFFSSSRAEAFNLALSRAQGKYVVVLQCGDELAPTFIEKCLLLLEASPPHFFIKRAVSFFGAKEKEGLEIADPPASLYENHFRALAFRRSAGLELGGYEESLPAAFAEWEFYVNLLRHGYVGCLLKDRIYQDHVGTTALAENLADFSLAKERIQALHLGYIINHERDLRRRARQHWQVTGALTNLLPPPGAAKKSALWLDLVGVSFAAWRLFPAFLAIPEDPDRVLIVTVDKRWQTFFSYNQRAGLQVYVPEDYHLQGKRDYVYSYLEAYYALQKVFVEDFLPVQKEVSASGFLLSSELRSGSRKDKVKILYVAPWLITGGADTMTVDWFCQLNSEWSEKYFATTLWRDNSWLPKIVDYAQGIYDLPALGCLDQAAMTEFLLEFIARQKIDILHIMNSEVAFLALPELKERFPGLKVVAQFHCFDYFPDGRRTGYAFTMPPRYDHLIDRYNLEYAELGKEIGELYPYIDRTKFKVIHGRIDGMFYDPAARSAAATIASHRRQEGLNLLFIGRLDRQKQPLRLLEIAAALRAQGVVFFMHVIGEGNLESQKKEFLRELRRQGLQDFVCWYGEQSLASLPDWYRIADILLLTSDWEGVPMVLYQAMAMEVVPVVAGVGGCAELVAPDCGFLVAEPDNSAAYVSAIKALADDRLRQKMAFACRRRMLDHFSLSGLDREYRAFYEEML